MGRCIFDCDEIASLIEHALGSTEFDMGYGTGAAPGPALLFVHDSGVYCMSNGMPRLLRSGGEGSVVAYASGCDPNDGSSFDDWYGTSRKLVGGDDFVETIPVDASTLDLCSKYVEMHIDVSSSSIEIAFARPRARVTQTTGG